MFYHWFYFSLVIGVSTILAVQSCVVLAATALLIYTCFKRLMEHEPGSPQSPVELVLFVVHWLVRFVYDPQQQVDMLQRQVDMMQGSQRRRPLPDSERAQIVELSDDEGDSEGERAVGGAPHMVGRSPGDALNEQYHHPPRGDTAARVSRRDPASQSMDGFWMEGEDDEKVLGGDSSGRHGDSPLLRRRHRRRGGESPDPSPGGPSDQILPVRSREFDSVEMLGKYERVRSSTESSNQRATSLTVEEEEGIDGDTPSSAPPAFE